MSFHSQECASGPCWNGGSCVDLIDKYACFCKDGYAGRTCEDDIDVCKDAAVNGSLCFNGATCVDGEGSNFTCRWDVPLVKKEKAFYCFVITMTQKLCLLQCSTHEPHVLFWCVFMWNVKKKTDTQLLFWMIVCFFEDFWNHCDLTMNRKDKLDKSWGCHISRSYSNSSILAF